MIPSAQPSSSPAVTTESDARWERVRGLLRSELGEATFNSWLKPLQFLSLSEGEVVMSVPTRFMREWLMTHFHHALVQCWQREDSSVESVSVTVQSVLAATDDEQAMGAAVPTTSHADVNGARQAANTQTYSEPVQATSYGSRPHLSVVDEGRSAEDYLTLRLDPRYNFDSFVVGKPNELAYAAARRVAESGLVSPGCNPLFLYGGVGLGKTHLMHAIAWYIRTHHPQRKVIYLSAEKFMYEFVKALRDKNTMSFKEQFRSVDVLMVDDVQFISGKDSTQEEFFHTFNALVDQNRQVVISGDRSPSDLDGMEERVKSRLGWGLVVDIHSTTYELRLGILQSKVESLQAWVDPKVLEFLAHKITSNVRELEGALNRVVAHATLVKRPVTLDTAQDVLRDLLRANDKRITIEDIQKKVAEHFNIRMSDMHSARRSRVVARPRQIAMFLAKKLTPSSLPEIGRKFGGKDHTTVMHAVKRVEELCERDLALAEDVQLLTRMLEG